MEQNKQPAFCAYSRYKGMESSIQRWVWVAAGVGLLLAAAPVAATAAVTVEFDVQPRALHMGETAQAQFTVRGAQNPTPPALPDIPGLQFRGPFTSSQTTIVNGRVDQSVTYAYQLTPTRVGQIKLGPLTCQIGPQAFRLPEIDLQVLPVQAAPDAAPGAGGNAATPALADLVFARLTAEPATVYQQQSFTLLLSVYYRNLQLDARLSLANWQPEGLMLSGFQELAASRAVISNQVYTVRQFRCQARALSSGRITLAPTVRGGLVAPRERRPGGGPFSDPFFNSFFDNPFFSQNEVRPLDISLPPLEITVKPWPAAGRPAHFAGAVGHFTLDAGIQPQDVAAGDPVTLQVQIEGQGNLENIAAPALAAGDAFKVYEPKLTSKEVNEAQTAGRKVFEQVVIPRTPAATNLPAVAFSFFNPDTGAYETLTRGPFRLTVRPAAAGAGVREPAAPEGRDIVYLKPAPARWRPAAGGDWLVTPAFWSVQAVPVLAVGAALLISRRRAALSQDVRRARRARAPRAARAALRQAAGALQQGQRGPFFEALWAALAAYFGNRLNLAPGEVSFETLAAVAPRAAAPAELWEQARALFAQCEQERFGRAAPAGPAAPLTPAEGEALLARVNALLRAFERVRL